ncbi:MAG: NUDIX domain-containing protein [Candidatus Aenigmarchaeota archaeon]|nr:NUDIX domain-containing protein [Candidatus Aenigmarchaeota archaeon]
MNEQMLILVDDNDNELGTAPRSECHSGAGKRHRAFVVILINNKGELLLQHRVGKKLGGDRWDVSATSHVLAGEDYDSAAKRSMKHELGIDFSRSLTDCGAFIYTEHYGDSSENEFCRTLAGEWNNGFFPNREEMSEAKFVPLAEVIEDMKKDATHKKYTKWFYLSMEKFLQHPASKGFLK